MNFILPALLTLVLVSKYLKVLVFLIMQQIVKVAASILVPTSKCSLSEKS